MDTNEMRDLAQRAVKAWGSDDEDLLTSCYAEDAVLYQAPVKKTLVGVDHIVARWRHLGQMGPTRVKASAIYIDGDTAVIETNISGSHTERFLDYEPTGREFDIDTCLILKMKDGKIVRHTTYLDLATVLRSLGLIDIESARPEAA